MNGVEINGNVKKTSIYVKLEAFFLILQLPIPPTAVVDSGRNLNFGVS